MSQRNALPSLVGLVETPKSPKPSTVLDRTLAALNVLTNVYRWTCLTGMPPTEQDWENAPDWPDPSEVERAFVSWGRMMAAADIGDSPIMKVAGELKRMADESGNLIEERQRDLARAEQRLDAREQEIRRQLDKERQRQQEAQRRADQAKDQLKAVRDELLQAQRDLRAERDELSKAQDELATLRLVALAASVQHATQQGELAYLTWAPLTTGSAEHARTLAAQWVVAGVNRQRSSSTDEPLTLDELLTLEPGRRAVALSDPNQKLAVGWEQTGDRQRWQIWWQHPLRDSQSSKVNVEVTVDETPAGGGAGLRVRLEDRPASTRFATPRLPRDWAEAQLLYDVGEPLDGQLLTLDADAVVTWAAEVLFNVERRMPVVALGDHVSLDGHRLAADLAAQAHVIHVTPAASWQMTEAFGREWSVWGDAVRVYWPGVDPTASEHDPQAHPLLRAGSTGSLVARVHRSVRGFYESRESSTDQAATASDREQSLRERLQRETERRQAAEGAHQAALQRAQELEAALNAARREAERLRGQNGGPAPAETEAAAQAVEFSNVLEAVQRAADQCRSLRFAPAAFDSAQESPFRRPAQIFDALLKLEELSAAYEKGSMGQSLQDAAEALGLRWAAGLSDTTLNRYGRHYTFRFEGEALQMGPHVSLGSGSGSGNIARIYLYAHEGDDQTRRGLIVGHVGVHLPDSTT